MSLLAWFPLTSNGENHGLDGVTLTTMGSVSYSAGKLGNSATFTGNAANCLHRSGFYLYDKFTWCCWFNCTNLASGNKFILSEGREYDTFGFNVSIHSSDIIIYYGGANTATIQTVSANTWYHLAVTVDSSDSIRVYINGQLVKTLTYVKPVYTHSAGKFVIGKMAHNYASTTNYFPFYGKINDVRIYDEVLSPKVIDEISKGLVCHYKLSGVGGANLIPGSSFLSASQSKWTKYSSLAVFESDGVNGFYRTSQTGVLKGDCNITTASKLSLELGQKYTFSGWYKTENYVKGTTNPYVRPYVVYYSSSGGYVTETAVLTIETGTNDWQYVESTFIVPTNSNISYSRFTLFARDFTGTVWWSGIKLEKGDKATAWCPNSSDSEYSGMGFNDSTEFDCSGLKNNGTKTGTFTWSNDTVRYNGSYLVGTDSSYIKTSLVTAGYTNSYTISYWAKITDMNSRMVWGFLDGNRLNVYPSGGAFCWNTGDGSGNPFKNNGTSVAFTPYNGGWHHYTITGDGTTTTLYIDGVKVGTATTYKPITGNTLFINGWDTSTSYKWTGGNISDFRIYATCLTAEDVKELYDSPISLSKDGTLLSYSFEEV